MLKIGHRGASAYALENTVTAFRKAMEMGADGVELDVHICKSGEPIIFHHHGLNCLKPDTLLIRDMTLSELQAYPLPKNERIPTLSEVLEALGPETWYFVEIKHVEAAIPVADTLQHYMGRGWYNERLCLHTAYHREVIPILKKAFPALTISASFLKLSDSTAQEAKALGLHFIVANYQTFTREHLKQIQALDVKVIAWTAYKDEPEHISAIKALGVDGIISNYPDRL